MPLMLGMGVTKDSFPAEIIQTAKTYSVTKDSFPAEIIQTVLCKTALQKYILCKRASIIFQALCLVWLFPAEIIQTAKITHQPLWPLLHLVFTIVLTSREWLLIRNNNLYLYDYPKYSVSSYIPHQAFHNREKLVGGVYYYCQFHEGSSTSR